MLSLAIVALSFAGMTGGYNHHKFAREPRCLLKTAELTGISALTMQNGEGVFLPFYDRIIASDVT